MTFFYGKTKPPFREHSGGIFSTFLGKKEYYDILLWENKIPFRRTSPEKTKIPLPATPPEIFFWRPSGAYAHEKTIQNPTIFSLL